MQHPFGLSHGSSPTDVQKLVLHEVVLFPSTTSVDPVARDLISKVCLSYSARYTYDC